MFEVAIFALHDARYPNVGGRLGHRVSSSPRSLPKTGHLCFSGTTRDDDFALPGPGNERLGKGPSSCGRAISSLICQRLKMDRMTQRLYSSIESVRVQIGWGAFL